jgi:hypothetical protein
MTTNGAREQYIFDTWNVFYPLIKNTGISPVVMYAISIWETQTAQGGAMVPATSWLAKNANNLFGMTKGSWTGPIVYRNDFGVRTAFRKYGSWSQSVADWINTVQRVYSDVPGPLTWEEQLKRFVDDRGLKYATDPNWLNGVTAVGRSIEAPVSNYFIGWKDGNPVPVDGFTGKKAGSGILLPVLIGGLLMYGFK